MAVSRNRKGQRSRGQKKGSGGIPAWFMLLGGIFIGLGVALFLMFKGYLPELKQHLPAVDDLASDASGPALIEDSDDEEVKEKRPQYEFFTVLPEMEVVVPEQELRRQATPAANTTSSTNQGSYVLQVGSFRNASDAEQMKARLALMGSTASVQVVTINDEIWHRVRLGPFEGAARADEIRRNLADNKIPALVMKIK